MEKAVFWLEVAILAAVILNIFKDLFWSKRQKEYYESITPTKVLGDLKSLNELLDKTINERDELSKVVEKLKQETERLKDEVEAWKIAKVIERAKVPQVDFGKLKDISEQVALMTSAEPFKEMTLQLSLLSESIQKEIKQISGTAKGYTTVKGTLSDSKPTKKKSEPD